MPTFREDPKLGSKVPMIKTADLNEQCVTNSKILDGCITKEKLVKGTVDATTLANKSVGTEKLSDSSVTNEKISNKAVSTEKLADGSITKEKIFNASITTEKLANESVSAEKLQSGLRNTIASTYDKTIELDNQKANIADVDNVIERLENKIGERFIVEGDVTNLPDEEDLTSVSTIDGREVMKLNDRAYEPSNFSGKGHKILRKNIKKFDIPTVSIVVSYAPTSSGDITITVNEKVTTIHLDSTTDTTTAIVATKIATSLKSSLDDYDVSVSSNRITLTRHNDSSVSSSSINVGDTSAVISVNDGVNKNVRKNILTQDMINQLNTIYVIRYDFDLDREIIEIKQGCTLKFEGGSLINGTLKGTNTIINNDATLIFNNIDLLGNFYANVAYPEWFGGIADNSNIDNTTSINKCLSYFNTCFLLKGLYYVSCRDENDIIIKVPQGKILTSNKRHYGYGPNDKRIGIALTPNSICNYMITMEKGSEVSNIYVLLKDNSNGLKAVGSRVNIESVCVIGANIGIDTEIYLSTIKQVHASQCNTGFKITGNRSGDTFVSQNTSISMIDCYAVECKDVGYYIEKLIYSNLINCACDHTGIKKFDKNTYKASYYLKNCSSVNMLGCGAEQTLKLLYCEQCQNLYISLNFITNFQFIIEKGSEFFNKYIEIRISSMCNFNIYGDFSNFDDDVPRKYIYIYDTYRDTVNILNSKKSILTVDGLSDTHSLNEIKEKILNNTILKGNAVELRSSMVIKNSTAYRPMLNSSVEGFLLYDKTLQKMILWNGSAWVNVDGTELL